MIDKQAFSAGMGILANNFNRTVDAAMSRVWYGVLSSRLTTEQFERAVERSISEDTFWPSAASLIAKVTTASPEQQGLEALEHVNRVLSQSGGHRFLSYEQFQAFDGPTKAAIAAVGGLSEICNVSVERHASLAKRFAAAYAKVITGVAQLAPSPDDPKVKQLVRSVANNLTLSGRDRAVGPDR